MREGARTCAPCGKAMREGAVKRTYAYVWDGDGVTAIRRKHCGRTVSGPDVRYCSANGFKVVLALSSLAPTTQARLLWLMHFAWALDPICMHHARKSGTKLNCRYIVPQDVGPGDTNKSPWKSRRRNWRTFAERLNSLESARVLVFFSLSFMHFIRLPLFSDFSAVWIRVRSKNRSALSSSVHGDSCIIFFSSYGFDKSDVFAL